MRLIEASIQIQELVQVQGDQKEVLASLLWSKPVLLLQTADEFQSPSHLHL
jgi:hypothetical protein